MMDTSKGICYVAFGSQYDYQCAHSVALIRKYSDIPVRVITNIVANQRCAEWNSLPNISFEEVDAKQNKNRYYKIRLDLFSPFDVTLFCDTDTAVQSAEFLTGFDTAQDHDVMFSLYMHIDKTWQGVSATSKYRKFIRPEECPAIIYRSGVFFFRKTESTRKLFESWENYWRLLGCGRDMPALFTAAARDKDLNLGILPPGWENRDGHIIIHAYGNYKVSGLPIITKYKPDTHNRWREIK